MATDQDPDGLFRVITWCTLVGYPLALFSIWTSSEVDHEVSPWLLFATSVAGSPVLHGLGRCFKIVIKDCEIPALLNGPEPAGINLTLVRERGNRALVIVF